MSHSSSTTTTVSSALRKELPFLAEFVDAPTQPRGNDSRATSPRWEDLFANEAFADQFWRALRGGCSSPARVVLLRILRQNSGILLKCLPEAYRVLFTSAVLACVQAVEDGSGDETRLLAVKVLQGMRFDSSEGENSSSLICLTGPVCESIVRMCMQHRNLKLKEAAVQLLLGWSGFPQVRIAFLQNVGLIDSLLEFGKSTVYSKEWILKVFVTLVNSLLHKTLEESQLVPWLVECAAAGETNRLRFLALACLHNISLLEFTQVLADNPAVKQVLIATASSANAPEENRAVALSTLACLAANRSDIQVALFHQEQLVGALVRNLSAGEKSPLLSPTLTLLLRLSYAEANEIPMFDKPMLIDGLLNILRTNRDPQSRYLAIETLNNLCCALPNNMSLFQKPGVVQTLLDCANRGEMDALKESAVVALQNLSYCMSSRAPLFRIPGMMESLLSWIQTSKNEELLTAALGTIYALAIESDNQQQLRRNHPLLSSMVLLCGEGTTEQIRHRAAGALAKLGIDADKVTCVRAITLLCSVMDLPRLSHTKATPLLPRDLVRRLAETLYLSSHSSRG